MDETKHDTGNPRGGVVILDLSPVFLTVNLLKQQLAFYPSSFLSLHSSHISGASVYHYNAVYKSGGIDYGSDTKFQENLFSKF